MKAHIILAHPEAKSFNSSLARLTEQLLSASYEVTFSDLYAMRFEPYDRPEHYADKCDPAGFHVQSEQRHHSEAGTTPADIAAEQEEYHPSNSNNNQPKREPDAELNRDKSTCQQNQRSGVRSSAGLMVFLSKATGSISLR